MSEEPRSIRWHALRALAVALAAVALPSGAAGVYVAGQGFTLEQAVEQALREQGREEGNERFWIVASREAAQRMTDPGRQSSELLERVRAHGGLVYVCGRDLDATAQASLPTGVGWVPADDAASGGINPPPQAEEQVVPEAHYGYRLILRACAALQ